MRLPKQRKTKRLENVTWYMQNVCRLLVMSTPKVMNCFVDLAAFIRKCNRHLHVSAILHMSIYFEEARG